MSYSCFLLQAEKGALTIASKSKSESKDRDRKHKKHKDRNKDKDREHKKHKHKHKDRSKDKDKDKDRERKKEKSGHHDKVRELSALVGFYLSIFIFDFLKFYTISLLTFRKGSTMGMKILMTLRGTKRAR